MPRSPSSLIASDGLEYKDLTQRLLGNPLDSQRNVSVRLVRRYYPQSEADAFCAAYDKRRGKHPDKHDAAWRAIAVERDRTNNAPS